MENGCITAIEREKGDGDGLVMILRRQLRETNPLPRFFVNLGDPGVAVYLEADWIEPKH